MTSFLKMSTTRARSSASVSCSSTGSFIRVRAKFVVASLAQVAPPDFDCFGVVLRHERILRRDVGTAKGVGRVLRVSVFNALETLPFFLAVEALSVLLERVAAFFGLPPHECRQLRRSRDHRVH